MLKAMAKKVQEMLIVLLLAILSRTYSKPDAARAVADGSWNYCLSWRLAVEANNVCGWRTVPAQCLRHIEGYMTGGQYQFDVELVMEQIMSYVQDIEVSSDGFDAWILDVDDTCISNLFYYMTKRYGCDPYDPTGFRAWAMTGGCPAIPGMLRVFEELIRNGFKVILLTGRDQDTLRQTTLDNLHNQGFLGFHQLIMRTAAYKGKSAIAYKSDIRKQLVDQGYRIWGNIGDQWSDLKGEFPGNRTFKLPNPMYFVP
ncbi:HAD superfamily subfamily IIIB acid phosphatase [Euphorbia peplus]|nr:HAD superfamily subfamily IIIB acid phosphatase [Euphorbia peplus]